MEKRYRLLREQLERDIKNVTSSDAPVDSSANLSWTPQQAVELEAKLSSLGAVPVGAAASLRAACLLQQYAIRNIFEKMIVLEKDGAKSALLKKLWEATQRSFTQVFSATEAVARGTGEPSAVTSSGNEEAAAFTGQSTFPDQANDILQSMLQLCDSIHSRSRQQEELVDRLSVVETTVSDDGNSVDNDARASDAAEEQIGKNELAEARRRLRAACYTGVSGGSAGQLKKIFKWTDKDRSGGLGLQEFIRLVRRYLKLKPKDFPDSLAQELFQHVDSLGSNDATITLSELESFLFDESDQVSKQEPAIAEEGHSSDAPREDEVFAIFEKLNSPAPHSAPEVQDSQPEEPRTDTNSEGAGTDLETSTGEEFTEIDLGQSSTVRYDIRSMCLIWQLSVVHFLTVGKSQSVCDCV